MNKLIVIVNYVLFCNYQLLASSTLCPKWSEQKEFTSIDSRVVYESSGLSSSIEFPGQRLYHINDSGSGATFHVSSLINSTEEPMTSLVREASAEDIEAVSVGPCLNQDLVQGKLGCVYLADIGDNNFNRSNVRIFIVAEKDSYSALSKKKLQINVRYENGNHNAEAFMVHPVTGDLYIITKKTDPEGKAATDKNLNAAVFMAKRESFANFDEESKVDIEFKQIGEIDVKNIFDFKKAKKYLVTDAAFSPSGETFVLLTLGGLVEIESTALQNLKEMNKSQFHVIPMQALEQQEAITFSSDGNSLYFSSEKKNKPKKNEPTTIYSIDCVK